MNSMNYKFIDTHCHLYGEYYDNLEQVLFESFKNDVNKFFVASDNISSIGEVLKLSETYENIYGCLGIHPDNISDFNDETKDFINENINNKKIIAIGEIGLDYFHNKENKNEQLEMLDYFLGLAENNNLPVIIHSREATGDLLDLLKKHKCKGIIHCFSGSLETAREYIKLGYKLGIGGILTFKNCNLKDVLKEIDLNNILLETDSPYLAPVPLRGLPNEPVNLNIIADYLCAIYNVSLEELAGTLEDNFNDVFNI